MEKSRETGFTLVELMIVVAIIALLAALAAPKFKAAVDSSRNAKVAHDLKVIQDALERHYQERGYYPVKLGNLTKAGYLKSGVGFRVPGSNRWYFYAVDNNKEGTQPMAYILGAPGKDAGPKFKLYHDRPLPTGIDANDTALAWSAQHEPNQDLWLFADDDQTKLVSPPGWLGLYRTACRQAMPEPCDVYTN